ncbi:hypothetical protein D3C80_1916800 [compost metagenome]
MNRLSLCRDHIPYDGCSCGVLGRLNMPSYNDALVRDKPKLQAFECESRGDNQVRLLRVTVPKHRGLQLSEQPVHYLLNLRQ